MAGPSPRLVEYFISVGIDSETIRPIVDEYISAPIRELRVISEKEEIPDGFERLGVTVTGLDAAIIKKGFFPPVRSYLCYTRDPDATHAQAITRLYYDKPKRIDFHEWDRVDGKIMIGKHEFCLCTKHDDNMPPIAEICIISQERREKPPHGFVQLPITVNGLTLCCRQCPTDALGLRYQTCIADHYPLEYHAGTPLDSTVAVFCQPEGAIIRDQMQLPTFLSFVLTDQEGIRMYAVTVTFDEGMDDFTREQAKRGCDEDYGPGVIAWPETEQLYHSKSVCIISYYPFIETFKECLKNIYRVSQSPGNVPIERYVVNLVKETPLPRRNQLNVKLQWAHQAIIFALPPEHDLKLLDVDLKRLFGCLTMDNVLLLFRAMCSQVYKIVFASTHTSLITTVSECVRSFLQPFDWEFTYIPVLPYVVFGILEAPMPILVGMHSTRLRPDMYDPEKMIVICDLDNNTVTITNPSQLLDLPRSLEKTLKNELIGHAKANTIRRYDRAKLEQLDQAFVVANPMDDEYESMFDPRACRGAFYHFFVTLMGPDYLNYRVFPHAENDTGMFEEELFQQEEYIRSRPREFKKFLTGFSQTQAFQKFVEDISLDVSATRYSELEFFKYCCEREHLRTTAQNNKDANPHRVISPMIEFLSRDPPVLEVFSVPEVSRDGLADDYEFPGAQEFPRFDETLFNQPRQPRASLFAAPVSSKYPVPTMSDRRRSKSRASSVVGAPRNTSGLRELYKTDEEWASFLLTQVYGAWFAAQVASITEDTTVDAVNHILDVLQRMSDSRVSSVSLKPDEPIYKACLVLCGRFKRKRAAQRIFGEMRAHGIQISQQTYGAYTYAIASRGAGHIFGASSAASSRLSIDHRRSILRDYNKGNSSTLNAPALPGAPRSMSTIVHNRHTSRPVEVISEEASHTPNTGPTPPPIDTNNVGPSSNQVNGSATNTPSAEASLQLQRLSDSGLVDEQSTEGERERKESASASTPHETHRLKSFLDSPDPSGSATAVTSPPRDPVVNNGHLPRDLKPEFRGIGTQSLNDLSLELGADDEKKEPFVPPFVPQNSAPMLSPDAASPTSPMSEQAVGPRIISVRATSSSLSRRQHRSSAPAEHVQMQRAMAELVDYSQVFIEVAHQCECGFILSDAHIMTAWTDDTESPVVLCPICNQNQFIPQLKIYLSVQEISMEKGISKEERQVLEVPYLSPLSLRKELTDVITNDRACFEDPEDPDKLRKQHPRVFWNFLWFCQNQRLSLWFLLGENDGSKLRIDQIDDPKRTKFPEDDETLHEMLLPIMLAAEQQNMQECMRVFLEYRQNTPTEQRNQSVWDVSMFDAFENLGIPHKFPSRMEFVFAFRSASKNLGLRFQDKAPSTSVLKFDEVFRHPHPFYHRLSSHVQASL